MHAADTLPQIALKELIKHGKRRCFLCHNGVTVANDPLVFFAPCWCIIAFRRGIFGYGWRL